MPIQIDFGETNIPALRRSSRYAPCALASKCRYIERRPAGYVSTSSAAVASSSAPLRDASLKTRRPENKSAHCVIGMPKCYHEVLPVVENATFIGLLSSIIIWRPAINASWRRLFRWRWPGLHRQRHLLTCFFRRPIAAAVAPKRIMASSRRTPAKPYGNASAEAWH